MNPANVGPNHPQANTPDTSDATSLQHPQRRTVVLGLASMASAASVGSLGLVACGGGGGSSSAPAGPTTVAVVSTLAGSGVAAWVDGTGTGAALNQPAALTVDASGNLFVSDYGNHRIRKISKLGVVSTIAGSGTAALTDGTGTGASFNYPAGIVVDASGRLYIADSNNNSIRKINTDASVITLAGTSALGNTDGTGTGARFATPIGLAMDRSGSLFVTEYSSQRIRKVTEAGVVSVFAGRLNIPSIADGTGTDAFFKYPIGITVDTSGYFYIADSENHRIRKATPDAVVSTLAGQNSYGTTDGTGSQAEFYIPKGVALDPSGNVFVADTLNHRIRKITPAGVVSTVAGIGVASRADGTGTAAGFSGPYGLAVDASGDLYVADQGNHLIRKITFQIIEPKATP